VATIAASEAPKLSAPPWAESARVWLFKTFFTNLCGATFHDWWTTLRENRFAIDPPYWPRAAMLTAGSVLNSYYGRRENKHYDELLQDVTVKPPLFILGHWRSGTTLLHNLLAIDEQFGYPNLYQVFFPHTFLCTEEVRSDLVVPLIPSTRMFDNVAQGLGMPNEDEFATCAASLVSPYMLWSFPRCQERYERYLTFRGVPDSEVTRWKETLVRFAKKLTLKQDRPLLLKSPPHTGRIKLLLELFPDARFLHIHRDPYTVFQSTKHLNAVLTKSLQFQKPGAEDVDAAVIRRYQLMHDAFFEERSLIPDGRFHELAFEDLERDPIGQVQKVYDELDLDGFGGVLPRLQNYVDSLSTYRKNDYGDLTPELRLRISTAWKRNFEEWGYPA
jgi:LPS sulfotransferase NodH